MLPRGCKRHIIVIITMNIAPKTRHANSPNKSRFTQRRHHWESVLKKVKRVITQPLNSVNRIHRNRSTTFFSENYQVASLSKEELISEVCRLRAGIRLALNEWSQVGGKNFFSNLLGK